MDLIGTIHAIAATGVSLSLQAARYTIYKALLDRQYQQSDKPAAETPGNLVEMTRIPGGCSFRFARADLEILMLAPDLARLSWGPGSSPLPYALARTEWKPVHSDLRQDADGYSLSSTELQINIFQDGSLRFSDSQKRQLRFEYPPEHLVYQKGCAGWRQKAVLHSDESVYGLGERASGFDLRGGTYRLWNNDPGGAYYPDKDPLYLSIPAYFSLHSAGSSLVFYENSFSGTVRFAAVPAHGDPQAASEVVFEDGMLHGYFIPGPPQRILERFTELTGRAPLPPRWVLGFHQSRWGYKTDADIRQVTAGFKDHDLPLGAVHLDIDYMDGYRVFTVDKQRFPNLKALADELHQQGTRLVTIIDTGVKKDPDYHLYQSGLKQNLFCKLPNGKVVAGLVWPGQSVFPDFTHPEVRQAWGEQYRFLLDQGVDGIWHDMNEPTSFVAWGDMTLPLSTCHNLEGHPGDHRQAHNVYALLMNRAAFEGMRRLAPQRRPWILSRSGFAGLQRYAWSWTGDTETSWGALRQTIGTVLGLGLSGIPFTGPDIGGFGGSPSAELFIRWLQLGAFLPFFRIHSSLGTPCREPWVYGEPYTSIARQALNNRARLLPYLYTSVWQSCQSGIPMARPLFWQDPADERLRKIDDAFLLGDNLLIAPMLEQGNQERQLTLPAGVWFNLWDGARLDGPAQVTLHASLDQIPVLVRGGSFIPMVEGGAMALHAYPIPGEHSSFVYDDAGDGYGPSRLDRYQLSMQGDCLRLERDSLGDHEFSYTKFHIFIHRSGNQPSGIQEALIDGKPVTINGDEFDCNPFKEIMLQLNPSG